VSDLFKERGGSDAWWSLPLHELLPKRYQNIADKLVKGDQVFDVWFDNAMTWNYILQDKDYHENNPVAIELT
jgi:isoleucyl-tRNA synthetase